MHILVYRETVEFAYLVGQAGEGPPSEQEQRRLIRLVGELLPRWEWERARGGEGWGVGAGLEKSEVVDLCRVRAGRGSRQQAQPQGATLCHWMLSRMGVQTGPREGRPAPRMTTICSLPWRYRYAPP